MKCHVTGEQADPRPDRRHPRDFHPGALPAPRALRRLRLSRRAQGRGDSQMGKDGGDLRRLRRHHVRPRLSQGPAPHEALRKIFGVEQVPLRSSARPTIPAHIGIYPVGTLVMLESGRLAIVLEQGEATSCSRRSRPSTTAGASNTLRRRSSICPGRSATAVATRSSATSAGSLGHRPQPLCVAISSDRQPGERLLARGAAHFG